MKKITLFSLIYLLNLGISYSQCTFSGIEFGGGSAPLNLNDVTEMSTCNYYGEYGVVTDLTSSTIYEIAIQDGGYITVFNSGGTPISWGNSPLTFTPPADGDYSLQWNGVGCTDDFDCHVTTVTNMGPSAPCNNPALAGATVSSVSIPCSGQNFDLSLNGASAGSGLTYQWQSSPDGVTYTNIGGATSSTFTTNQTVPTYYQCIVTCSGGSPATSTPINLGIGSCIIMSNSTETTCAAGFFDSGSNTASYLNDENYTMTIIPSTPGTLLQISFSQFEIESFYESMSVYNGNSTAAPLLGTFDMNPESITSTAADGSLTITFTSDGSVTYAGWVAEITCVTPPSNDFVCNPISLPVDGSVSTFNNGGSTVEAGEAGIAPPVTGYNETDGWGNNTLSYTTWFTFVAPAGGNISIDCSDHEFDGQVSVYTVTDCSDFLTFDLVAANDNSMFSGSGSPDFKYCGLTPGNTYYLMYDSGNSYSSGEYTLSLSQFIASAGTFVDTLHVCSGDSVVLFDAITDFTYGGVWEAEDIALNPGLSDSLFASEGFAGDVYNFRYINIDVCAMDSISIPVKIWDHSNAGGDGVLMACRNETLNLVTGLSGTTQTTGEWYDPADQLLPGSWILSYNVGGSFNYEYFMTNGPCPSDSSIITVVIDGNCNMLDVSESSLEQLEVYPNPTNGKIEILNPFNNSIEFSVKNLNGQNVMESTYKLAIGTNSFDLSNLESGVYLIQLTDDNQQKVIRIVKQ